MTDNKITEIRKRIIQILESCNDSTELQSYYNIINRNYSWLLTGVSVDIKWLIPYTRTGSILSFCCGIKFFDILELKILMSLLSKKIIQCDTSILEKSIKNRRKIDYTWDMILLCRRKKLKFTFTKEKDYEYYLIIQDSISKTVEKTFSLKFYFQGNNMTMINDQLEIVPRPEKWNSNISHKNVRNIHQFLSRQFLLNYYS